jgi:hypothetical protein
MEARFSGGTYSPLFIMYHSHSPEDDTDPDVTTIVPPGDVVLEHDAVLDYAPTHCP